MAAKRNSTTQTPDIAAITAAVVAALSAQNETGVQVEADEPTTPKRKPSTRKGTSTKRTKRGNGTPIRGCDGWVALGSDPKFERLATDETNARAGLLWNLNEAGLLTLNV